MLALVVCGSIQQDIQRSFSNYYAGEIRRSRWEPAVGGAVRKVTVKKGEVAGPRKARRSRWDLGPVKDEPQDFKVEREVKKDRLEPVWDFKVEKKEEKVGGRLAFTMAAPPCAQVPDGQAGLQEPCAGTSGPAHAEPDHEEFPRFNRAVLYSRESDTVRFVTKSLSFFLVFFGAMS